MVLPSNIKAALPDIIRAVQTALGIRPYEARMAWALPHVATTNALKAAQDISNGAVNITSLNLPDYPRNVTLTIVDSAVAAIGSVTVASLPHVLVAGTGTVVVGTLHAGTHFKIRQTGSSSWTDLVYNSDFSDAATLADAIDALSYVSAANVDGTITVTGTPGGAADNSIQMAQVGTDFTLTQVSGGVDPDTLVVAGNTYTFVASDPSSSQIAKGANVNGCATNIAARLTADKTALGLSSATASTATVTMTVTPAGEAGDAKVLTVDGTRITKIQFTGGGDAGDVTGTLVITGKDPVGANLTASIPVNTGTSLVYTTAVAFSKVTSVTGTLVNCQNGNTLAVGTGPAFAIPITTAAVTVVREVFNGVASSSLGTLSRDNKLYTPNATPDGSKPLEVDWVYVYAGS